MREPNASPWAKVSPLVASAEIWSFASFEKVFTLDDPTQLSRLERLIKGIPSEYLLIAEDIVAMLRRESDSVIDDSVLIALTDHILHGP